MSNKRLYRRARDGVFYACVYDAKGERHRFSTRCTDRAAAEMVLRREERIAQATSFSVAVAASSMTGHR